MPNSSRDRLPGTAAGRPHWCCGANRPRPARNASVRVRARTARGPVRAGSGCRALPCTTSTGEPICAMREAASKRCVISGPTGSQPQRKLPTTSGTEVNAPSTISPASSSTSAGQLHRDRAAQRMAEDVARRAAGGVRPASPRRHARPRRPASRTAACRCCGRSRGSRCRAPRSPARACGACGTSCCARPSARRAGTAAPARRRCGLRQPQAVQAHRRVGLGGVEVDPHVLHAVGGGGAAPPGCGRWAGRSTCAAVRRASRSRPAPAPRRARHPGRGASVSFACALACHKRRAPASAGAFQSPAAMPRRARIAPPMRASAASSSSRSAIGSSSLSSRSMWRW